MHFRRLFTLGLVTVFVWIANSTPSFGEVDFTRDIRPILSDNCFKCHGPDEAERSGGFRFDLRESAIGESDSGEHPIVPGHPEKSELMARISSDDESMRMPPADSGKVLTGEQIEKLRAWIEEGAKYELYWAFVPPVRPDRPTVVNASWPANEIDRFVLARLEEEQIAPSPLASREKLLRRLSLDLIGIPPTPEEVKGFLSDNSPGAYERQVERLLASPHFGEKWARHWLDVARYADSNGYEKDLPRDQHHWRDWVIRAINTDMPYDEFAIEQLAGDLLPNATQDQRVATGFLRNGMINQEGGVVYEQFRMEGLIDRMDCLGKAFLGLTVQCAQCHTHKFDPISHEEYYRMLAFLNNDYEAQSEVFTDDQLAEIGVIHHETQNIVDKIKAMAPDWQERMVKWEVDVAKSRASWSPLENLDFETTDGAHPEVLADGSALTLGGNPTDQAIIIIGDAQGAGQNALMLEALTHGDLPFGGPGRSVRGTFALSEVEVDTKPLEKPDEAWQRLEIVGANSDFEPHAHPVREPFHCDLGDKCDHYKNSEEMKKDEQHGSQPFNDTRVVGPAAFLVDGDERTAWGSDRDPGRRNQDLAAVLHFKEPLKNEHGSQIRVTLKFRHGGPDPHGRDNALLGRFKLSLAAAPAPSQVLPRTVRLALDVPVNLRTSEQLDALFSCWRESIPDFKESNAAIEQLSSTYPEGESVLNVANRLPELRRKTFILDRGNWQQPTTAVEPGVLAVLNPLPPDAEPNRLTLARWLVDRKSPTTARVAVNRVWQAIFGVGLVETSENFGVQASPPSHPQLLDWLAVEFMDRGWSLKQLLRTIVSSATYRQESRFRQELMDRDPNNRLLARGPSFRVEAEVARDSVLSVAGLLNEQVGGPSYFPPVPESVFATSYIEVNFWKTALPPDRYRRSLYVFRRRSMPDPVLSAFDAPNGEISCPRRIRSNTPLAALTLLNEPVFIEAARALALRVLRDADVTDRGRASRAFLLCTSRQPTDDEVKELISLLDFAKQRLAQGWLSASAISTGDFARLPDLPANVTPADAAAWTVVARVLLNLDETVTKN